MLSYYKKQEALSAKVHKNITNLPAGPRKVDTRTADQLRADGYFKSNTNKKKS